MPFFMDIKALYSSLVFKRPYTAFIVILYLFDFPLHLLIVPA